MKNACLLLLLLLLPFLGACHHERRATSWEQARTTPYLDIPEGMDTPGRSAEMVIPDIAADIPGSTYGDARPPVNVVLVSEDDPAAAWSLVNTRIKAAGVGRELARDDARHRLALDIAPAELPQQDRGFFARLFRSSEERNKREYFVAVAVNFVNGETRVSVDGDARAAMYLGNVLEGPGLRNIASAEDAIAVDLPPPPPASASGPRDAAGG